MENKRVKNVVLSFMVFILSLVIGVVTLPEVVVAAMPSDEEVLNLFDWGNGWQDNGAFSANIRTSRYRENQVNPEDMIDSYGNMTYELSRQGDTHPRLLYVNYGYYLRRAIDSPEKPFFTKTADNVGWTIGYPRSWNNLPDHLDSYTESAAVNGIPTNAKYDIPVNKPIDLAKWPNDGENSTGLFYNIVPQRNPTPPYEENSITMDFFDGTRQIKVKSPYTGLEETKTIQGRTDTTVSFFTKMNFDDTKVKHAVDAAGNKQFDIWPPHTRWINPQVVKVQYRDVETKKELKPEETIGKDSFLNDPIVAENLDQELSYYKNLGYQEVNGAVYQSPIIYGGTDITKYKYNQDNPKVSELRQGSTYTTTADINQKGIIVWYEKQRPSPELDKEVEKSELKVGATQAYTVTLKNGLTSLLKDATLEDTLPEGMKKPTNIKLGGKVVKEKGWVGLTPYYEWDETGRKLTVVTGSNMSVNSSLKLTYNSVVESGVEGETKRNVVKLIPKSNSYNELLASASFKIISSTKPKAEKYSYHTGSFTDAGNPGQPITEVIEKQNLSYMLKVWNEAGSDEPLKNIIIEDTLPMEVGEPTNIRLGMTKNNAGVTIPKKQIFPRAPYYEWSPSTRKLKITLDEKLEIKPGDKFTHVTFDTKLKGGEPGDQVVNRMTVTAKNSRDFHANSNFTIIGNRKVTFDSKGGSKIPESPVTVKHGNLVKKPIDPVMKGYTFEGWYLDDGDFNKPFNFNNPIVKDITLYAKWLSTAKPNPDFTKTVNKKEVKVGEEVEYRVRLRNPKVTGQEIATISQPIIVDTLPEGVVLKEPITIKRQSGDVWIDIPSKDKAPSLSNSYYELTTVKNPSGKEQQVLTLDLQDIKTGYLFNISYLTVLKEGTKGEDKVNSAVATAKNIPTPIKKTADFKVVEKDWKVDFEPNGGTPTPKIQIVGDKEKAKEPTNTDKPVKKDHVLEGWYKDKELKDKFNFDTQIIKDTTLYAKWTNTSKYTVSFKEQQDFLDPISEQYPVHGELVIKPADPVYSKAHAIGKIDNKYNPDKVFVGWYLDKEFKTEYDFKLPVESDLDLYAKWMPKQLIKRAKKAFYKETLSKTSTKEFYENSMFENEQPNPPKGLKYSELDLPGNSLKQIIPNEDFSYAIYYPHSDRMDYIPDDIYEQLPPEIVEPKEIDFYTTKYDPKSKKVTLDQKVNIPEKNSTNSNGSENYFEFTKSVNPNVKRNLIHLSMKKGNIKATETTGFVLIFDTKWKGIRPQVSDINKENLNFDEELSIYNIATTNGNIYRLKPGDAGIDLAMRHYLPIAWVVNFELNGGDKESKPEDQNVKDDRFAKNPSKNPTHTNRKFAGWYKDKELKQPFDFTKEKITKNTTVYAKWTSPIVDPGDGVTPIDPVDEDNVVVPTNPDTNGLRIQYVSPFNFGEHENTFKAVTGKSFSDKAQFPGGKIKDVPVFVSIIDDSSEGTSKPWELHVSSTSMYSPVDNGLGTSGASIHLKDMNYADTGKYRPLAVPGDFNITNKITKISESGPTPKSGTWSLSLGNNQLEKIEYEKGKRVKNREVNKSTGSYLNVPQGKYKQTVDDYHATINWTIVPKVSGVGG